MKPFASTFFTAATILVSSIFSAFALPGDGVLDPKLGEGIRLHNAAVEGDGTTSSKAIAFFQDVLEKDPDNHLARVYLGSSYTLRGRDIGFGPTALEALRTGEDHMNTAVAKAPTDPKVVLIRAINFLQLPAIFNKRKIGRTDLQTLLGRVRDPSDKTAQALDAEVKQVIYLFAGEALRQLRKKDDAIDAWKEGKAIKPNSSVASLIDEKLD